MTKVMKPFQFFILVACFTLICSQFVPSIARAEAVAENNIESTTLTIPDDIEITSEDFENVDVDVSHTENTTEFNAVVEVTEETEADVTVEIEQGTDNIFLKETILQNDSIEQVNTYKVTLVTNEQDETIAFEFTNVETGETYLQESQEGLTASFAPAIPIGISIGSALISHLIAAGTAITIGGATMVLFTKAKRSKQFEHFKATISNGKLYIGGGVNYTSAVNWSKKGKGYDTWSTSKSAAKKVATGVRNGLKPVGPEIDSNRSGKFYHYHPYGRSPSVHAFYGTAQ